MKNYLQVGFVVLVIFTLSCFVSLRVGHKLGSADTEARIAKEQASAVLEKFNKNAETILKAASAAQVEIVYKDRYFHTKEKEIEKVTIGLEHCPLSDAAVRLWNQAAVCSIGSTETECEPSN